MVGKDVAFPVLAAEVNKVSVPLRGIGWESLGVDLETAQAIKVSVPLRGIGWESLGQEFAGHISGEQGFRPLAGNWLGKLASHRRETEEDFPRFRPLAGNWLGKT